MHLDNSSASNRCTVSYTCVGIVGTAKAVLSESSNDQNQAFGMSLLACSWGLGLIIGPALSGISADPLGQYNISLSSK